MGVDGPPGRRGGIIRSMLLKGFFPPIPTPFAAGEFAPEMLAENLARWNDQPVDGFVVLGSNGEAPLLDEEERAAVVKTARRAIPGSRRMIVGTGRESTRATIRSTKEAFYLGADAVLVGVPSYYKPAMTNDVLRDHYLRVADASPGPMLLYTVPFFTGLSIDLSLYAELIPHDRIIGIKDSAGEIGALERIVGCSRGRADTSVLIGNARLLARGLEIGASGGVLAVSCIAARICAEIGRDVAEGRGPEARRLNDRLLPLVEAVGPKHGIGGLKAALDLLHFHGGDPRPPLRPAGAEARAEIAGLMKRLGLLT